MCLPKHFEYFFKRNNMRVKHNFCDFCMACSSTAYLLISRIINSTTHITRFNRDNTFQFLKNRFYTPKTTTDKHYYHMQIIRSLQARLPEAVYKKLSVTLNLRIQGEQLVFNMFRGDRVQEVKADFTVPTISVCVENLRELAQDPVNFLIACYAEMIK